MEDLEAQAAAKPDLDADARRALVEGEDQSPEKMEGLLHWAITSSDESPSGPSAAAHARRPHSPFWATPGGRFDLVLPEAFFVSNLKGPKGRGRERPRGSVFGGAQGWRGRRDG